MKHFHMLLGLVLCSMPMSVTALPDGADLAIFYKDFGYSQGLIKLGRINSGIDHLKYQGSKNVTIELVSGP